MESCNQGHYESIKKALEEVGLTVGRIQKKEKKIVIIAHRNETCEETTIQDKKDRRCQAAKNKLERGMLL